MSALRSVLSELSTDPGLLSDVEVEEELVEVSRAMDVLHARFLRLTAEVDRRRPYAADGVLSTARHLAVSCDLTNSTARRQVATARALERMPRTAAAFSSGDLSSAKVGVLARAAAAHPQPYAEHEELLLGLAAGLTVGDLQRAVDYWRHNLDGPLPFAELADRSHVSVSRTWQGMVRLDALLDPEAGETIITALQAAMPAPAADAAPLPTAGRRRAEALTHLCRSYLDRGDVTTGGQRPHLTVLADLETLERRAGYRCELDNTGSIPAETARRLACDAQVTRIITRGRSQPLDLGRATRTVTPAQRRAVTIRDRHCRFPGCDRPPPWSDVHHIIHWLDHGPGDLDNLLLLCRRHHTLIHEGGYQLTGTARAPTITRPDGTILGESVSVGCHQPPGG
jgi:hypothetical protein